MSDEFNERDAFTELIASSRSKFGLAQTRLRRGYTELGLLSLHGANEDALRAYLVRKRLPTAGALWGQMLDTLRADEEHPLSSLEFEQLMRLHTLRSKIARGEQVTVTRDSVATYYNLAVQLLPRYGVQVLAEESKPPLPAGDDERRERPRLRPSDRDDEPMLDAGWQRYQRIVLPLLLIVSIFFIGVVISLGLQQFRAPSRSQVLISPTATLPLDAATAVGQLPTSASGDPATLPTTASEPQAGLPTSNALGPVSTPAPPGTLAPGRTAFVRPEANLGLAVRAQPGTDETIPVIAYIYPDTAVEVIDGPVQANGFTWWQVRAGQAQGWCAGEFLEVR